MPLVTPFPIRTYGASGRGFMGTLEHPLDLPFPVCRAYYIYGVEDDQSRGNHAHREANQLVVALAGSLEMVFDNGFEKQTVSLDAPDKGYLLTGGLWREMKNFAPGTVMLILTDQPFNEEDLIRDRDEFLSFARARTGIDKTPTQMQD